MKRTRRTTNKYPSRRCDAILAADIHIRSDTPICRTDDYWLAQVSKIEQIFSLCNHNECPLLIAGDLGHKSQWSNWLLEWFIGIVNQHDIEIIAIPGQHDLPEHRLADWEKSGCGVLHTSNSINLTTETFISIEGTNTLFNLICFPYSIKIISRPIDRETGQYRKVAMAHQMVIENKPLWPGQEAPKGHELLKKFPEYDLILTGDNHNPFVAEYKGRLLVNPGSMMRMTADQIDHKPRVYKWWAKENIVEPVYLNIEEGEKVITRKHIDNKKERDDRMDAYVNHMSEGWEVGLSYENNLDKHFNANRTRQSVKDKVWAAVEG